MYAHRHTYLDSLGRYCAQVRMRILASCLTSDHVWWRSPKNRGRWQWRCSALTAAMRFISMRRDRAGPLWQNRFYSCAPDEPHLRIALRYVELNPVRANLIAPGSIGGSA
jgi:putative transposase